MVVALLFAPGPWMANACAGTLAQLQQAQAVTSKLRAAMQQHMQAHVDLCVGVARSPSCRVAFESALRQTSRLTGFREPFGDKSGRSNSHRNLSKNKDR